MNSSIYVQTIGGNRAHQMIAIELVGLRINDHACLVLVVSREDKRVS